MVLHFHKHRYRDWNRTKTCTYLLTWFSENCQSIWTKEVHYFQQILFKLLDTNMEKKQILTLTSYHVQKSKKQKTWNGWTINLNIGAKIINFWKKTFPNTQYLNEQKKLQVKSKCTDHKKHDKLHQNE